MFFNHVTASSKKLSFSDWFYSEPSVTQLNGSTLEFNSTPAVMFPIAQVDIANLKGDFEIATVMTNIDDLAHVWNGASFRMRDINGVEIRLTNLRSAFEIYNGSSFTEYPAFNKDILDARIVRTGGVLSFYDGLTLIDTLNFPDNINRFRIVGSAYSGNSETSFGPLMFTQNGITTQLDFDTVV